MLTRNLFVAIVFLIVNTSYGQLVDKVKQLPLLEGKYKNGLEEDWMLQKNGSKAGLFKNEDGQLVFSNALISRTFSVDPAFATVGMRNLITDEGMLRAVKPEASIEVDGLHINVGGLLGQPVYNFLKKDDLKLMTANQAAFQAVDFRIENTKERFPWKRRMEWIPKEFQDVLWPAPGKELIVSYQASEEVLSALLKTQTKRDARRELLIEDGFNVLDSNWSIRHSQVHNRANFENEGKPGELYTLSNSALFAERDVPEKAEAFVMKVNPGTDESNSHGLGLALQIEGKWYKISFAGRNKIYFYDGENYKRIGSKIPSKDSFLRLELANGELLALFSEDGEKWKELKQLSFDNGAKATLIRIGKMNSDASVEAVADHGKISRSKVEYFAVLGAQQPMKAEEFDYLTRLKVEVHYELYDNLPLMSKWITINNGSSKAVMLNKFKSELLAVLDPATDPFQLFNGHVQTAIPNISVETDFSGGRSISMTNNERNYRWLPDSEYVTNRGNGTRTANLLDVGPQFGPDQQIAAGASFESYRVWEMFHDSRDRERKGLQVRKMWRTISPWIYENPVFMHLKKSDPDFAKKIIDQCADVGFEMVILSFGSGADVTDASKENVAMMKDLADYAHSKDITIGGYSLLASRSAGVDNNVISPEGMKPRFGRAPCLESEWGRDYFESLYKFYGDTGHDIFEHDGSYAGDVCASTNHPGHKGLADSHWNQYIRIRDFYRWCRSKGIYLTIPDVYFANGGSKTGMGYREKNWSLPRRQQDIIERQNIYAGTWEKTPTMGWMHVPLEQYHGGGAAATYEPLKDHLEDYETRLANLFGLGVQAAWRGSRLYDTAETKTLVKKWVDFYKEHRAILDSDLIHVRQPDGQDYDAMMHVNPDLEEKGLLMVYNPLDDPIQKEISVNLYYTGLKKEARISEQGGKFVKYKIADTGKVKLMLDIPANSRTWFVIKN